MFSTCPDETIVNLSSESFLIRTCLSDLLLFSPLQKTGWYSTDDGSRFPYETLRTSQRNLSIALFITFLTRSGPLKDVTFFAAFLIVIGILDLAIKNNYKSLMQDNGFRYISVKKTILENPGDITPYFKSLTLLSGSNVLSLAYFFSTMIPTESSGKHSPLWFGT